MTKLIVSLCVLTVGAALATIPLRRLWRGDLKTLEAMQGNLGSWWPLGDAFLRGWIRASVAGCCMGAFFIVLGAGTVIARLGAARLETSSTVETVLTWSMRLGLAGAATMAVLSATVILFNRPSWIVPPNLRGQPGALREWTTKRRRRENLG